MNEHAKKIWKAALESKTVQHFRGDFFEQEWVDMDPFEVDYYSRPQQAPDRWRIKPKTEISYYRVYRVVNSKILKVYTEEICLIPQCDFEKKEWFGGWVGRTQSYEVEAEE